jgi:excisionase family DNA binding protein
MTQWFSRRAAAEYISVSPKTIDTWAREGRLTKYKISGTRSVRFSRTDLDALVEPDDPESPAS